MSKESLFLIKPGEKSERIAREAVDAATSLNLIVSFMGRKVLAPEEAIELYRPFEREPWFSDFMSYMTSGATQVYLTEGEGAIEKTLEVRRRVRKIFAIDRRRNAIHSPKTKEDSRRNIELFRRIFP